MQATMINVITGAASDSLGFYSSPLATDAAAAAAAAEPADN